MFESLHRQALLLVQPVQPPELTVEMTEWQDNIKNERTVSSMENNLGIRINEKEEIQVTGPIKAPNLHAVTDF